MKSHNDTMDSKLVMVFMLCIVTWAAIFSASAYGQSQSIPAWVKNNAKWWADGTISDIQYLSGVQYLVSQGVINGNQVTSLSYNMPRLETEIKTNSSVSIGYYGIGQVSCSNDEILTGGGYYSANFHQFLSVYRNGPSDDGKKWIVEMMQSTWHYLGTAPQFTTYAMCTKITS
jgi:hypothetical protein